MWADAQCDGLPAEYRWHPLRKFRNSIPCIPRHQVWLTAAARVPCSNATNIGERKTWTQSEFCRWQNSVRGQIKSPQKCIYSVLAQETAKHPAKFCWPPLSDVGAVTYCTDVAQRRSTKLKEAKTQNRLKFAGVPQTRQQISAISGPKFTMLWGHCEEILLYNCFPTVRTCLSCKDIAGQSCAMVPRWRYFGDFCILYFQRAACSTF